MQKIKLSTFRNSLNDGYLAPDWRQRENGHESIMLLSSGYIAMSNDVIKTNCGCLFHEELERDSYCWDEFNEDYICFDDSVTAYGRRRNEVTTTEDSCIYFNGHYYISRYLDDNDIVELHNGDYANRDETCYVEDENEYYLSDDCFYWDSDGCYHLTEEQTKNLLYDYNSGPREKDFRHEDIEVGQKNIFGWGVEIEKNEMPNFDFEREKLYDTTGAVIESDSSVSDGFELKTPIYNLNSSKTLARLQALKDFCNVKNVEGAGGHIGFSMDGKSDQELLELCRGFLPLIYAMHKKRVINDYCTAKKIEDLKADCSKYQAIRLRGNYIEFRIFSSVKSFNTILFRLDFFRIMSQNLGVSFARVCIMAIDINHPLHNLLTRVYHKKKKFLNLIETAIDMDKSFVTGALTQKAIKNISKRINKTFIDKETREIDRDENGNIDNSYLNNF